MSLEAQFYEARRRQSAIDRRQSLRSEKEMEKQIRQCQGYHTLYIPVRLLIQAEKSPRCTCTALPRLQFVHINQPLYQRDRDIYPRSAPKSTNIRRYIQSARLPHRFTSTDYLQQW